MQLCNGSFYCVHYSIHLVNFTEISICVGVCACVMCILSQRVHCEVTEKKKKTRLVTCRAH